MSAPDPFGNQAATTAPDPFGGPVTDGGDPFAPPKTAGGALSPTPEDLAFRLLMFKFLKETEETTKYPDKTTGKTTGMVYHVNMVVLDGGPIVVTKQGGADENYQVSKTTLGEAPMVFTDNWVWQVGIKNSIHKNQFTLGRLVRHPTKETQKTFPDRAALEALFTAQPHLITDPKGPKWFWMLAEFTPEDAELARKWLASNPKALDA